MKKNLLLITAFLAIAGTAMAVDTAPVEEFPELPELGKIVRDESDKATKEEVVKKYAKMVNKDGYVSDYRYNKLPIVKDKLQATDVEEKLGIAAYNTAKTDYDEAEKKFIKKEAELPSLKEGLNEAKRNYEKEEDKTRKEAYKGVMDGLTVAVTTLENEIEGLKTDKSEKEEVLRGAKEAANKKLSTFGTDVEKYSELDQAAKEKEKERIVGYGKELELSNRAYKKVAREYVGVEKATNGTDPVKFKEFDKAVGRIFENAVNTEKNAEAIKALDDELTDMIANNLDYIEDNETAIKEAEERLTVVENVAGVNLEEISKLDNRVSSSEIAIATNAGKITENEIAIAENKEAVAALDEAVETLEENVSNNTEDILENAEAIAKNTKNIRDINTRTHANSDDIKQNTEAIEDLDTYVDALSDTVINNLEYIEANEKAIVENKTAIVENKTAIARNTQDIKDLRKDHNRGMAQMAAMASVDFGNVKARTVKVGAAVGQHSSETAVAVGVAVAPTDALMVNAKWSTSANSIKKSTLGLGATYEFNF